mmetsp:Transcript_67204/g.157627  ORF Transcript_67204/g.157627 Transcript_67204/m.157627 type:complete len:516 (-) Transcript_67204:275-1822(-)
MSRGTDSAEAALMQTESWGSIEEVVNAPVENVAGDATWLSVLCMWLTLPLNLIQGCIGGLCRFAMAFFVIGCYCCRCIPGWICCAAMASVKCGRPCILAPSWWRYVLGGFIALLANSRSRLALFIWEWEAFGKGDHYWHGEGYWSVTYEECSRITKSQQKRRSAFACIEACVPDLFASNILLFLPTGGPESEWAAIRKVLHAAMLDRGAYHYTERLQKLSSQIAAEWPEPKLTDFDDTEKLRLMVVKCVFFMIFGIWLDDNDALILRKWRDYAVFFVLPRLIHRFIFNFAIGRVKQLRVDTVGVIEKHGLQPMFVEMNKNLPEKYRRPTDVKLCDEIMFAVGFAGIGGTSACCETVGAFLQRKIPEEASAHLISFEKYPTTEDMLEAYKASPVKYIKESCRIAPPVTSATRVDPDERELLFKGIPYTMPPETLNQYVISMANRDTKIFENPDVFDPTRKELDQALTWNGAFGTPNEETVYPRICPGRFLALDVAQAIVGHVVGIKDDGRDARMFC